MSQIRNYYGNNDYRDYLAHHGVLGQRKGVRHGPPYPLDYEDHSAAEKRGMAEKGVRYMGIEGSVKVKKKSFRERLAESKAKKIEAKKAKLADEAIREGTAANISRNRDLFTPDEIKDITKRMDERAEANRLLQARSSDFRRKAETRQTLLEKGNPKKILKNMDQYSIDEINDAAAKIAARQKLTEAVRNERLKAIESYVQKGASITKSIGDIANNLYNIKSAYDKITGADKPSSAIQSILNSGDPQKILGAINSGLVSAKEGKDALDQARTKVALQKMIDNPGTDGTGNGIKEQQNQNKGGKNKNKNKDGGQPAQGANNETPQPNRPKSKKEITPEKASFNDNPFNFKGDGKSAEQNSVNNLKDMFDKYTNGSSDSTSSSKPAAPTDSSKKTEEKKSGVSSLFGKKKQDSGKQEEKKSPASSVMDMIPESFRKDAAERAASYKEEKKRIDAEQKAEKKQLADAKKAAKKRESDIKRLGEAEYEYRQAEAKRKQEQKEANKQIKEREKKQKEAAAKQKAQDQKIKTSLEQFMRRYTTSTPDTVTRAAIRNLQNASNYRTDRQRAEELADAKQRLKADSIASGVADRKTKAVEKRKRTIAAKKEAQKRNDSFYDNPDNRDMSTKSSSKTSTQQSSPAKKQRSASVERHLQAMSKVNATIKSSTGPLTLNPEQKGSSTQVKAGAEKLAKAAAEGKQVVDRIIGNLDEPNAKAKKRK